MKKILLIMLLIFAIGVDAQETTTIIKEAPDSLKIGETLSVNIVIKNSDDFEKNYEIKETIPQGVTLVEPINPDEIQKHDALEVMIYKWEIIVPENQAFNLNYKIKPNNVGEYVLSPTKAVDLDTGSIFLSESKNIIVSCVPDNSCRDNENYINCPEDCGSSLNDGICNYKADGICDPDCEEEPDCNNIIKAKSIYMIILLIILLIIILLTIRKFAKKNQSL